MDGIGAIIWLAFMIAIGWAIYLNAGTFSCRAGNIGQAIQAQTVCQPTELRLPRKPD